MFVYTLMLTSSPCTHIYTTHSCTLSIFLHKQSPMYNPLPTAILYIYAYIDLHIDIPKQTRTVFCLTYAYINPFITVQIIHTYTTCTYTIKKVLSSKDEYRSKPRPKTLNENETTKQWVMLDLGLPE